MQLIIYSLEGCPYSMKSESLLKLYKPKIVKVTQAEKDKYKKHLDKKMNHIRNTFFTDKVYQNSYKTNINELSYNNKDMISNTWSKLNKTINDDDSISTLDTDESLLSE